LEDALFQKECQRLCGPKQAMSSDRLKNVPWKESVAGKQHKLLYMPFLEWQKKILSERLDLRDLPFDEELSYQSGKKSPAVIESFQFESEQFRKIRMTYIDAGTAAQVLNCVIYPRYSYDAPILGIDFLAFGKNKVLAILDLQPLTQDPAYLEKYIDPLVPLRNKYEDLCGRMSSRFYDEARFFSKELLFGRFDNDGPVMESLFPASQEYLLHYLDMIDGLQPNTDPEFMERVHQMHVDYDQYSAEKDPAVGLFKAHWGEEWAHRFTYEFLFSHYRAPAEGSDEGDDKEQVSP